MGQVGQVGQVGQGNCGKRGKWTSGASGASGANGARIASQWPRHSVMGTDFQLSFLSITILRRGNSSQRGEQLYYKTSFYAACFLTAFN